MTDGKSDKNPHGWAPFHGMSDAERRKWQEPESILKEIGLKPGDTFMDIGCSRGFFAIPAARLVGERGTVYGVDVNEGSIEDLKKAAINEGLYNIKAVTGEAESTIFCESCADFIFFGIDLHDFRDPRKVLQNAHKMLKPDGHVIDLDWSKEPSPFGPPMAIRFGENKAKGLIEEAGFKVQSISPHGPYHYLIIAAF